MAAFHQRFYVEKHALSCKFADKKIKCTGRGLKSKKIIQKFHEALQIYWEGIQLVDKSPGLFLEAKTHLHICKQFLILLAFDFHMLTIILCAFSKRQPKCTAALHGLLRSSKLQDKRTNHIFHLCRLEQAGALVYCMNYERRCLIMNHCILIILLMQ